MNASHGNIRSTDQRGPSLAALAGVLLKGAAATSLWFPQRFLQGPGRLAFDQLVLGCCLTGRWSHPVTLVWIVLESRCARGRLVFSTRIYSQRRLGMGLPCHDSLGTHPRPALCAVGSHGWAPVLSPCQGTKGTNVRSFTRRRRQVPGYEFVDPAL